MTDEVIELGVDETRILFWTNALKPTKDDIRVLEDILKKRVVQILSFYRTPKMVQWIFLDNSKVKFSFNIKKSL
jgi:hypothetical protein